MTKQFKSGETVRWSSQALGQSRAKEGVIEQVVPIGELPDRERFPVLYRSNEVGMSRNHLSYVVRVPGKTSKSAGVIYWPRVTHLCDASVSV